MVAHFVREKFIAVLVVCLGGVAIADECVEYHVSEIAWPGWTSSDVQGLTAPQSVFGGSVRILAIRYQDDEFTTSTQGFTLGYVLWASCAGDVESEIGTTLGGNVDATGQYAFGWQFRSGFAEWSEPSVNRFCWNAG